jgi:hypothetical protein
MIREGQKRGNEQYRSEVDNSGSKIHSNLSSGVFHASLSADRDHYEQQTDQGRGCRRHQKIEIPPLLQFIHKLTWAALLCPALHCPIVAQGRPCSRRIESSALAAGLPVYRLDPGTFHVLPRILRMKTKQLGVRGAVHFQSNGARQVCWLRKSCRDLQRQ